MKPLYEMTFEEFKENVSNLPDCYVKNPESLLEILFNRLKEALTPNPDEIHIIWSVDHVYGIAEKHNIPITLEQAREVLRRVKAAHEAPLGVKWDVIDCALYDVYDEYCEGR